jgi:hypothetical protein
LFLAATAAGLLLSVPAVAQAPLAPSLSVDTRFAAPDGIARDDIGGNLTDIPSAVAVDGDRIYTVGEVRDSNSNSDVAVIARRSNGSYDTGFSGDGKLVIPIAADTGKDVGTSVVVLPDGRLRVLASTDATAGSGTNIDNAIVGLNPDGSRDAAFGGGDGLVVFPAGANNDTPTRLALGSDGRLAVAGAQSDGTKENAFVSLREPDGSPVTGFGTGGVRIMDRAGPTLNDRAVDVVFRPGGGLLTFIQNETNPDAALNDYQAVVHAVDETGADDGRFSGDGDLVLAVGEPDTVPGGLMVYEDRVFAVGSTKVGGDTDAFLARMDAAGESLQFRRFDMRGQAIQPGVPVTSAGSDMAVVPGATPTLVVTGSINYSSRPYWAAAAFNNLGGDVASFGFGDAIIPTDEYGAIVGVAAGGDGWAAIAGSLVNTSENFDTSFGATRLLVDVDKRCDLAIDVPRPLEVGIAPGNPATVTVQITNVGTKACGGTVSVPAPYELRGPTAFAPVPASGKVSLPLELHYGGYRILQDVVPFTVRGDGDVVVQNDTKLVNVVFDFCDLGLRRVGGAVLLPSEGGRAIEFTVRNAGTIDCAAVRLGVGGGGRLIASGGSFALRSGRSATDVIRVGVRAADRRKSQTTFTVTAGATKVANEDDDSITTTARIVQVADSAITAASRRSVRGRATGARGGGLSKKHRQVSRVEVSITRAGKRCAWVQRSGAVKRRSCSRPVWLRATGKGAWRLALRKALPRGRWVIRSRAVAAGFPEASFTTKDRNLRSFTVR